MAAKAAMDSTMLPKAPSLTIRMFSWGAGSIGLSPACLVRSLSIGARNGRLGGREMGHPMLGDVEAAGDPDSAEAAHVVQQPLKPGRSGWVAHDAHVEAYRQHLGVGSTFLVE